MERSISEISQCSDFSGISEFKLLSLPNTLRVQSYASIKINVGISSPSRAKLQSPMEISSIKFRSINLWSTPSYLPHIISIHHI